LKENNNDHNDIDDHQGDDDDINDDVNSDSNLNGNNKKSDDDDHDDMNGIESSDMEELAKAGQCICHGDDSLQSALNACLDTCTASKPTWGSSVWSFNSKSLQTTCMKVGSNTSQVIPEILSSLSTSSFSNSTNTTNANDTAINSKDNEKKDKSKGTDASSKTDKKDSSSNRLVNNLYSIGWIAIIGVAFTLL